MESDKYGTKFFIPKKDRVVFKFIDPDEERKIKEQIAKEQAEEEAKQRKDKGVTEAPVAVAVETPEAPVAVEADAAE